LNKINVLSVLLLRYEFARAVTAHWEDLVLKGYDDPYFVFRLISILR
jgi:hypothetical protein